MRMSNGSRTQVVSTYAIHIGVQSKASGPAKQHTRAIPGYSSVPGQFRRTSRTRGTLPGTPGTRVPRRTDWTRSSGFVCDL
eukprot:1708584-Rhodomonas_salina.1